MGMIERVEQTAAHVRPSAILAVADGARARLWPALAPETSAHGSGHAARMRQRTIVRDAPGVLRLTIDEDHLLLIVPGAPVRVLGEGVSAPIDVPGAALIARPGEIEISHAGPVSIRAAFIPRGHWQALVASHFEAPLRLRRALTVIGRDDAGLDALLDLSDDRQGAGADGLDGLCLSLIEALDSVGPSSGVWELVAPLKRATDFILGDPGAASSWEVVAAHAGMTTKTLQRQARTYLGMTLSAFIRDARLTAAHHSLGTARDSRSIARIASDYGFASGGSFTRSYVRRYGETPTETRVRAVSMQA